VAHAQAPGTIGDILGRVRIGKDGKEESIGGRRPTRRYLAVPPLKASAGQYWQPVSVYTRCRAERLEGQSEQSIHGGSPV
jgi:hypothetical protein